MKTSISQPEFKLPPPVGHSSQIIPRGTKILVDVPNIEERTTGGFTLSHKQLFEANQSINLEEPVIVITPSIDLYSGNSNIPEEARYKKGDKLMLNQCVPIIYYTTDLGRVAIIDAFDVIAVLKDLEQ